MLRRKHNKSRYGCSECKRRHMKCDETRPSCVNCKTGNRSCSLRNISANFPQSHRTRDSSTRSQGYRSNQQDNGEIAENSTISRERPRENEHENENEVTPTRDDPLPPRPEPYSVLPPPLATPYSTVRELETAPSLWSGTYRTPTGNSLDDQRPVDQSIADPGRSIGLGEHLFQCLAEADLAVADAQEMFGLFRDRISSMIPSFYATSFSHLPSQPLFALAAIYTVARYLPDSANLRSRVFRVLRRLLAELVLQSAGDQQTKEVFENMHGLVILYAYCEATGPSSGNESPEGQLDALMLKGIVEGYAVKFKIGIGSPLCIDPPGLLPQVWLVWLYTMSHQYVPPPAKYAPFSCFEADQAASFLDCFSAAVIHGCTRTLSSTADIRRAKRLLEQHIDDPQVQRLLAEYDLCLIWENLSVQRPVSLQVVYDALHHWQLEWNDFVASVHGRQLYFHYLFTRFHLITHLQDDAGEPYVALPESLEAAKDFIHFIQNLTPINKDRLRYSCDFAFVLMAYVCLYILRSLDGRVIPLERREEFRLLVKDLSLLMQSFDVKADTRPAIYGYALDGICKQYESSQLDAPAPLSPGMPMDIRQSTEESSLLRPLSDTQQLSRISDDAPMNLASAPELMQQSRFPSELWTIDSDFSIFDSIMAVIPVPEV